MDGDIPPAERPPRIDVQTEAMLTFADGSTVRVIVTDISHGGFRLRSEELLEAGEKVQLRDRHGEAAAEIRWVDGFTAGGVFLSAAPKIA